jgi:transposase
MKKHSTAKSRKAQELTIGVDLGDRSSRYCTVDGQGEVVVERSVATTKKGLAQAFGSIPRCRIALEVGTHSPWVSRLLRSWGHEVVVANARRVRLITDSSRKNDRLDARTLARLARIDPELLSPVKHRSAGAQMDLLAIRARAVLVESRTRLVNAARGLVKSLGERLRSCDAAHLGPEELAALPEGMRAALRPLLAEVESLSETIHQYDLMIEQMAQTRYPETQLLRQVPGVGPLIALTDVLTLEDPGRFAKSRDVGAYMGLRPRREQSGKRDPELRITKEGDPYLRQLLVQGAHYILGPFGPDTDLRRWGQKLAARGRKNAKKRARVAVARKLAVLLHKLWATGEVYEPLRNATLHAAA